MKKFLLGIILPVLTLVTLIGTGFATWYFNGNLEAKQNASVSVSVEQYAQVGTLSQITETFSIKLDQPNSNGQNIKVLSGSQEKAITSTYTAPASDAQLDSSIKPTLTITVVIQQPLQAYIGLANGWTESKEAKGTWTKTVTYQDNATLSVQSSDFKYLTPDTTQGIKGEPKNKKDYDDMVTAASGQSITVKFDATITKPSA